MINIFIVNLKIKNRSPKQSGFLIVSIIFYNPVSIIVNPVAMVILAPVAVVRLRIVTF